MKTEEVDEMIKSIDNTIKLLQSIRDNLIRYKHYREKYKLAERIVRDRFLSSLVYCAKKVIDDETDS